MQQRLPRSALNSVLYDWFLFPPALTIRSVLGARPSSAQTLSWATFAEA